MAYIIKIGLPTLCSEGERLHDIFERYLFGEVNEAFTDRTVDAYYDYITHRLYCKECKDEHHK